MCEKSRKTEIGGIINLPYCIGLVVLQEVQYLLKTSKLIADSFEPWTILDQSLCPSLRPRRDSVERRAWVTFHPYLKAGPDHLDHPDPWDRETFDPDWVRESDWMKPWATWAPTHPDWVREILSRVEMRASCDVCLGFAQRPGWARGSSYRCWECWACWDHRRCTWAAYPCLPLTRALVGHRRRAVKAYWDLWTYQVVELLSQAS